MAAKGYTIADGMFSLPCVNLIYTPQCLAEVICARDREDHDLDEQAILDIEAKAFKSGVQFIIYMQQ
jgi:hypothetical protein